MFDLAAARKAGYTDAEIADGLAKRLNFDLGSARSAGYSDGEIITRLIQQNATLSPAAAIPTAPTAAQAAQGSRAPVAPAAVAATPENPGGILNNIVGAGETALTALTGATGGTAGMAAGTLGATAASLLDGSFGTQQAAQMIEQAASEGAQRLTYAPRTQAGQAQTAALGQVAQALVPLAGVAPQVAALGQGAAVAAPAVMATGRAAGARGSQLAQQGARAVQQRVQQMRGADAAPTARYGSVGAAGTDDAAMRAATAEALPVPIPLTRGQATRDFEALRFEGETAKNPTLGAPLRERAAQQNTLLSANLEAMIDETGARALTPIETGRTVDRALVTAAARRKAEYRAKYQAAEKAGQMDDPVSTAPLIDYLTQNESLNQQNLAGGSLGLLQRELVRLGGADVVDGQLVPRDLPLKQMELLRRQMNNAIDAAPDNATNVRAGAQIKGLIDQATEGMGGDLYKEARASRRRYAQLFEDNAIVRDLLRTRRGTADRQVALEDVVRRTILNGDRESLSMLRRTLQVAGGEEGAQAWKELQGATVRYMMEEATKGVGTDIKGNPIFSAAKFNNAVRTLDADGRLDFVLSKKGAQTVRDLNEIAKVVLTLPPGSVNTSNTAGVLLTALAEAGATGSMTGLPLPVLTGLRQLSLYAKDRSIAKRVQEALNSKPKQRPQPTPAPGPQTIQ